MSAWTKLRDKLLNWFFKKIGIEQKEESDPETNTDTPADKGDESANGDNNAGVDDVPFTDLNFEWGGFNGSGAEYTGAAIIGGLNVSNNGLSYSWEKGGCEAFGAANADDYTKTLACLFCLINGVWRGGKFDWISTSRLTRDFHNIETAYNGWDKDAISKATAFAFVIVAANGKTRTNVIKKVK